MSLKIALAPFLKQCAAVLTLGIRACMSDYIPRERELMRNADRIFFPTPRYVDVFEAASKPTFPSPSCYRFARSRVLQTLLFQHLGWPAARARLYFGRRQKRRILDDFSMPFDALPPDPRHRGSHRIRSASDLQPVLEAYNPLVIREVVPWEERLRLVSVHYDCIAVQRLNLEAVFSHEFLSPASLGPELDFVLTRNRELTRMALLDDIVTEWGRLGKQWHIVEMSPPPLHIRFGGHSISRHAVICDLIVRGVL